MQSTKNIRVGILTAPSITYRLTENGFILDDVIIGVDFHWQRKEQQAFSGQLEIINHDGQQIAVNIINLEDYIQSVISSEMSANSPIELLKAHSVISRSWAMRAMMPKDGKEHTDTCYERASGHTLFDVCADDHCQRYQGLNRQNTRAIEAAKATQGEILTYGDEICDTRYYKCCGGKTEIFSTCWEDIDLPYLQSVECPFCNTHDQELLSIILNGYDQETQDFHDWTVQYTTEELSHLIHQKSGIDFGTIVALNPLKRGKSGRIYSLEIVGTKCRKIIGKELTIRKYLSPSHLYSSWFDVHHQGNVFKFTGHGWGHGVGLCQIGAAVMASQGYDYKQILAFYFPGTTVRTI